MRTNVLGLLFSALDEVNQQLPQQDRVPRSEAAPISGPASALDSLAFLSLVVTVEERVGGAFHKAINLATSLADIEGGPPPRTVGELADLVVARLGEAAHG